MGADKALLQFRGRPLVEHAVSIMRGVCSPVSIVGQPEKFSTYGVVVEDTFVGCGPLGGIHAGLKRSSSDLNLFLAVDMPFVSAGLLGLLFSIAERSNAMVVVPRTSRGLQPLCAVYQRGFAAKAEESLQAGRYKIDAVFTGLPVRIVEESELEAAGFSEHDFFNVNTPEDLLGAESSVKPA